MNDSSKKIVIKNLPPNILQTRISAEISGDSKVVHFLNTYNLSLAQKDKKYFSVIAKADFNLVDGKILQICLRKIFHLNVFHNRGTDLLRATLLNSNDDQAHLFVCSNDENVQGLRNLLANANLPLKCDFVVLPFTNDIITLLNCVLDQIANRSYRYIWIGIGTPKQDLLADLLRETQKGSYIFCVGAALDFIAGIKKEAPRLFQNLGLEWTYRLFQEPQRLFSRYFLESWGFISLITKKMIEIESK